MKEKEFEIPMGYVSGHLRNGKLVVSLNEEEKVTLAQHLGLKDDALMHELPLDLGKEVEEND